MISQHGFWKIVDSAAAITYYNILLLHVTT